MPETNRPLAGHVFRSGAKSAHAEIKAFTRPMRDAITGFREDLLRRGSLGPVPDGLPIPDLRRPAELDVDMIASMMPTRF